MESTNVAAERRDNKVLVYLAKISTNQVKFDDLGTEEVPKRFHTLFTKLKQDLTKCINKGCPRLAQQLQDDTHRLLKECRVLTGHQVFFRAIGWFATDPSFGPSVQRS